MFAKVPHGAQKYKGIEQRVGIITQVTNMTFKTIVSISWQLTFVFSYFSFRSSISKDIWYYKEG